MKILLRVQTHTLHTVGIYKIHIIADYTAVNIDVVTVIIHAFTSVLMLITIPNVVFMWKHIVDSGLPLSPSFVPNL